MANALTILYTVPATEALDLLIIEQGEWAATTGTITKAELVRYLAAMIDGTEYTSSTDCGFDAHGDVLCLVDVYPLMAGLVYQFHTSHGSLSGPVVEMVEATELLNFTLSNSERPNHPARSIRSVSWLDKCYDASGAVVSPPPLAIDGDTITIPSPVYGSVSCTYTTERHRYTLTAPRRTDAVDGFYEAVVYGLYDGGLNWLQIEMPPGITTFAEDADADCGLGGGTSTVTEEPDDDTTPVADDRHTRTTVVDYCSQTIISDTIT